MSEDQDIYPPQDVVEEWSRWCDCCSSCSQHPCGGIMAGGMCDQMPCRCDDYDEDDGDDDE